MPPFFCSVQHVKNIDIGMMLLTCATTFHDTLSRAMPQWLLQTWRESLLVQKDGESFDPIVRHTFLLPHNLSQVHQPLHHLLLTFRFSKSAKMSSVPLFDYTVPKTTPLLPSPLQSQPHFNFIQHSWLDFTVILIWCWARRPVPIQSSGHSLSIQLRGNWPVQNAPTTFPKCRQYCAIIPFLNQQCGVRLQFLPTPQVPDQWATML